MTDFLTCEATLTVNVLFHATLDFARSFVSCKNISIEHWGFKLYNYQKRYEYKYIKLYLDYKAYSVTFNNLMIVIIK